MQKKIRLTWIYAAGFFAALVIAVAALGANPVLADAPLGCPGSTQQGPISPSANYDCPDGGKIVNGQYEPASAFIPLGCPGSTQQGPIDPNASYSCPNGGSVSNGQYQPASSSGSGGNGSGATGPTANYNNTGSGAECKLSNGQTVQLAIPVNCNPNAPNVIYAYLDGIIQFMSLLIGLVAVLMIVVSGFQYVSSAGNPDAVAGAKKRLANVVLGVVLWIMLFGILNYLLPGGVL